MLKSYSDSVSSVAFLLDSKQIILGFFDLIIQF